MKISTRLTILATLLLVWAMAGLSFAQGPPPRKGPPPDHGGPPPADGERRGPQRGKGPPPGPEGAFLSAEGRFDGKIVKGAPYSARAIIEITQTLSDGTRIVRKSTSLLYRDGEGRTRREQDANAMTPFAPMGADRQLVFISDPVSGFNYALSPQEHTGRKFSRRPDSPAPDSAITLSEGKVESLGKQKIEGVEAEGTRSTITIPAGQIGNDRPINIISERWYSSELQVVVMSKHNDPRVGEHLYRLMDIKRGEPAHALFEVPSDYQIQEGRPPDGPRHHDRRPMFD